MGRCGPSCSPYNGLLRWTFLLLVFGSSLSQAGTVHRQDDEPVTYTDQWAVHIEGGQQVADEIARRNDFINLGKVRVDYSFLLTVFCFLVFHENVQSEAWLLFLPLSTTSGVLYVYRFSTCVHL